MGSCRDIGRQSGGGDDQRGETGLVETASRHDFDATIRLILAAIEGAGLAVMARIDHAAGALQAGLSMPPTMVLLYGNPKGGTDLMLAAPLAALDLPLRVLVREEVGRGVLVAYHPIAAVMRAAGVPEPLARRLEPAQELVVRAIAS